MPWLIMFISAIIVAGILNIIFNDGDNMGELVYAAFLIVFALAAIIGLGVGTSYSRKPEHYHFINTTYNLVECGDNILTLTKDTSGNIIYNYIYEDGTGKKVSGDIPVAGNVVFEYSDTATPTITISDAVYNSKIATAWFVDPTVRNIKIVAPKNSIVNTLY